MPIARRTRALLFTVLIAVVMGEVVCRLVTALFVPDLTSGAIRAAMGDLRSPTDGAERPANALAGASIHPYLGYVTTPGLGLDEKNYPVTRARLDVQVGRGVTPEWMNIKANNWGFWSPYTMPYRREPDDFVIVILGGSVANWFALQGEATLSEELRRHVPTLAAKNIVVLNMALGGYKQPQQLLLLAHLLARGVIPDAVVNLDGFNEAAVTYYNSLRHVSPDYPRADVWPLLVSGLGYSKRMLSLQGAVVVEKEATARFAAWAARWSTFSNVLGVVLTMQARRHQAREQILQSRLQAAQAEDVPVYREFAARGPSAQLPERARDEEIVRLWFESSVNLSSLCRGHNVAYLHVLQPTLQDSVPRPSKPLTRVERRIAAMRSATLDAWTEGVRRFYPRFRERADALREKGVAFLDLSRLFESRTETIYYDICHYNQLGNEMLARAIVERWAPELVASSDS